MTAPTNSKPVIMNVSPNNGSENQMPNDVNKLQHLLKNASAQLQAHTQAVQELTKANIDLKAAMLLMHGEKNDIISHFSNLLKEKNKSEEKTEGPLKDEPKLDADTVQA